MSEALLISGHASHMRRPSKTPRWLNAARKRAAGAPEKQAWLSRALARAGLGTLAFVERAIAEGRVKLDGKVEREPFAPVPAGARVQLDGRGVFLSEATRVLAFHKPKGIVTAARDPEGKGTVFEALERALPAELQPFHWHAVGRLDRDTTGLLLFTNDERFVAHASSPATHLPKRYLAQVGARVTPAQLAALEQGVTLSDGPTLPARARARGPRAVELTLTQGKNHQVKRMLGKVGLPVLALHREAVGQLELDVEEGQLRELSPQELHEKLGYSPRGR